MKQIYAVARIENDLVAASLVYSDSLSIVHILEEEEMC